MQVIAIDENQPLFDSALEWESSSLTSLFNTSEPSIIKSNGVCNWYKLFWSENKFVEWIIFGTLSVIFYFIWLIEHYTYNLKNKQSLHYINIGYLLCCILSILIALYSILFIKDVFKTHTNISYLTNVCRQKYTKTLELQSNITVSQNIINTLQQIKTDKYNETIELESKVKLFQQWCKQITDDHKMELKTMKKVNGNKLETIQNNLIKKIKQKQLQICQMDKHILSTTIYNIIAKRRYRTRGYINVIDFDSYINLWPNRYKKKYEQSGKTFRYFVDETLKVVIDDKKLNKFIDKMIVDEIKNDINMIDVENDCLQLSIPKAKICESEDS